jgi:hypothetical protein
MIATGSLASCRWLLAGPMERGRMFRRRFLPVVLFAVVGVTVHSIVQEFRPDRTVLFDAFRPNREFVHHRDALTLPQLLDVDGPQIPVMAEGVREYLGHTYGLDVTKGRVEALIRSGCLHSGWKEGDKSPLSEEAVFAAMDRVHDDLVGEIVAADRRRIAVNACVGVLLCIVLLRGQLVGFTSRWAFSGLLFAGCAVIFAPVFAPRSSVAMAVVAAERAVLSFVERISLPVALLVFVALALLLWKSCERAFRRLDLTDLPPMTNAWGKAQ